MFKPLLSIGGLIRPGTVKESGYAYRPSFALRSHSAAFIGLRLTIPEQRV